jgi:hypothetical protein
VVSDACPRVSAAGNERLWIHLESRRSANALGNRGAFVVVGGHGSGRTRTAAEALRAGRLERWLIMPRRPMLSSRERNLLRDAVTSAIQDGEPGRSLWLMLDDIEDYFEAGAVRASLVRDWVSRGVQIIATAERYRWLQLKHVAGRRGVTDASGAIALATEIVELASPPTSEEASRA